jgi:hypothetical protein
MESGSEQPKAPKPDPRPGIDPVPVRRDGSKEQPKQVEVRAQTQPVDVRARTEPEAIRFSRD